MEEQLSSIINDKVSELRSKVNQLVTDDDIKETVQKMTNNLENFIRKNPIPAVAGAVILGFVLGKILKR